jgi:hypothetical protein
MGDNTNYQSGNGNNKNLYSIYKLNYFENKNLKIKKIVCGSGKSWGSYFSIFLTG